MAGVFHFLILSSLATACVLCMPMEQYNRGLTYIPVEIVDDNPRSITTREVLASDIVMSLDPKKRFIIGNFQVRIPIVDNIVRTTLQATGAVLGAATSIPGGSLIGAIAGDALADTVT